MKKPYQKAILQTPSAEYGGLIGGIAELLEAARRNAARTVNALMTATYWEIGRRIVEFEQQGKDRAGYGEQRPRPTFRRPDIPIRTWVWPEESFSDSGILSRLSVNCADIVCTISERADAVCTIRRPDSLDTVNRIAAAKKPDTVWPIGSARSVCAFSFAMVALCAAALRERRTGTRVLSRRGAAGWLERAPARPPDCLAILRTHRCLTKQERHAPQRSRGLRRGFNLRR